MQIDSTANEITASPILIEALNIEKAIVTVDAMMTQKAIARKVKKGGGDYVMALKDN
jgi:predicted transposase YbfD/YdcC